MRITFVLTNFFCWITLAYLVDETRAYQRFCGQALTVMLNFVCNSTGFNPKPLKRFHLSEDSDYNSLANGIVTLNMSDSKSLQYPGPTYTNLSKHSALSPHALSRILSKFYNGMMLTQTRRRRQRRSTGPSGVQYECCLKACSRTELSSYCL